MGTLDKGKGGGPGKRRPGLPASTRPYLIRAIYEWAVDSGLTPQIRVDTRREEVVVPPEYVREHEIVLNIHPQSVRALQIDNKILMCSARFSGKLIEICVPVFAVMAVYARENGIGITFEDTGKPPPGSERDPKKHRSTGSQSGRQSDKKPDSPPHLKLVN